MKNTMEYKGIKIEWLNHHAGFLITTKNDRRIFIDPWEIKKEESADIILITHSHYDHFSPDDIRRIKTNSTSVIAPIDCREKISGAFKRAGPGTRINEDGIVIEAVPAYNIRRFRAPGEPFHPAEKKWNGYVIDIDGILIYHSGDTDFIEEMKELKNIDVALVPCGGIYTMDGREAGEACNAFMPKVAVPMHWGKIVGTRKDADDFAAHFKGETRILE